jgi:hypothetical protein
MTRRPPYQAQLRVYEPLAHLPEPDRERWQAYARTAPSRAQIEAELHAEQVRRLAGRPPVPVPAVESRHAFLLTEGDDVYVCPVQPRLQVWHRLGSPDDESELLPGDAVPLVLREQAAADLASHLRAGGEARLFTRTAAWQVPLAWFVPFAAQDRTLTLEGERALTYRTAMGPARRRAALGLRTARAALGDVQVADDIEQVARWLEDFDPRSRVELDYGGLVDLLSDAHLTGDDSASDVAEGLAALEEGDPTSAAAAYRRWTSRWQRVRLLSRAC